MVDYSPAGVAAHRDSSTAASPQECARQDGQGVPGRSRHRVAPHRIWTSSGRPSATTRSTTSASATAPSSAPPTPSSSRDRVRAMVLDGAIDPTDGPGRVDHPADGRLPDGVQRLRRRLREVAGCPLGTDPAQAVNRYHQLVDPLVAKPGPDVGPARPELPGRDHRHRQRALHAAVLEVPDQRAARACSAAPTPATCCCSPTSTRAATTTAATTTGRTRSTRSAASTTRRRPIRRSGPTPTSRPARSPRSWPTAHFTGFAPRDICAFWPVPPTSAPHPAVAGAAGQASSWSRPPTIRRRRTRPVWTWPASSARR